MLVKVTIKYVPYQEKNTNSKQFFLGVDYSNFFFKMPVIKSLHMVPDVIWC